MLQRHRKFVRSCLQGKLIYVVGFALWLISSNVVYADEFLITGNGSESANVVAVTSTTQNTSAQENNADVQNTVVQNSETGGNTVSGATGGTSTIQTGDVTTNTTIENKLNSSQVTSGCCLATPAPQSAIIAGNGNNSQNQIAASSTNKATVTVTQNATIKNTIKGTATTGNNLAYRNTGDVTITTGDIHSNITVVNDPINLSYVQTSHSIEPLEATIFGNGSLLTNTIIASTNNSVTVLQHNNASIDNLTFLEYLTGGNKVVDTDGVVKILTGDIYSDVVVKNKANMNVALVSCNKLAQVQEKKPSATPIPQKTSTSGNQPSNSGVGGVSTSAGQILPEAASTERNVGGPSIYGLSKTSNDNVIGGILLGAVFIAFGAFLFFKGIGSTTK